MAILNKYNNMKDGTYRAEIVSFERISEENKKEIHMVLRISEGPHEGVEVDKIYRLVNEKVLKFMTEELGRIGITARTGEEFDRATDRIIGAQVEMKQVTNDSGYPVYYLNKLIASRPNPEATTALAQW